MQNKRHIAKAITWRIIGTLDTMILSWIISGSSSIGFKVGIAELITKTLLYYLHERIWANVNLLKNRILLEARKRHIAKTITWRIIGTLDTIILSWVISGDALIGLKIGFAEVITKMVMYYLHERLWYRINFGLPNRKNKKLRTSNR